MKKIAISLLIVLVAIFAFFYIQLQQAKNQLTTQLAQHNIYVKSLEFNMIPQPTFTIEQLNYHEISLKQIEGKLAFFPLIIGEPKLEQLAINQVKFSENALNSAKITFVFSDFLLKKLFAKNLSLNGKNRITVEFEKPIYGKNKSFHLSFNKGQLTLNQDKESLLQLDNVALNGQILDYIEVHADFSKPHKMLAAYINPVCTTDCLAVLKFNSLEQKSAVRFSGKNFPMAPLLTLLSFPNTMSGTTDFTIQLTFFNAELMQGKFDFNARDGELLGLNLLDLAAQYFPINYNDDLLKGKSVNTAYQSFRSSLSLKNHLLSVNSLQLKTPLLVGEGHGAIDLHTMQCDINLNLSATNEKYQRLKLPIRFFGSCYSPQYKLEINKDFRKQLKDLIKEKLK
ncbi:AsmA-like C-terminal region-containing protein [Rodentibacter trehalosifermentans]|uniref:Uncharacterized protein n=1 Tax=Rodentibacter trehalosifermentans TaxID=1908263 RepID=A0A1V3J3B9_9PAST|nr:AsmA-like C-terminal region-containing protein [Rodentibacter trehalosifermentans]OOF49504.1 hypothetical protein BKK52_03050 [Rodentibacter trehalosifermentans]OOF52484.1 hypothetical protein BKK53_05155 [Rodentibacter trehalosifermentans]